MGLFRFNSQQYDMFSCFTCLCNFIMHRKLRCIGNFDRYVPIRYFFARRSNACVRICTPLQVSIHETDAKSELQRYTAEIQDRAPLQAESAVQFWLDREPATRDCLSWHWIAWRLLPLKPMLNDYIRCVVI